VVRYDGDVMQNIVKTATANFRMRGSVSNERIPFLAKNKSRWS